MPQHMPCQMQGLVSAFQSFDCGRDPEEFVRAREVENTTPPPCGNCIWFDLTVLNSDSEPASSFSGSAFAFVRKGERRAIADPPTT